MTEEKLQKIFDQIDSLESVKRKLDKLINYGESAKVFFEAEFKRQDDWLNSKGLTVADLDQLSQEEYQEINSQWHKEQKALKEIQWRKKQKEFEDNPLNR